jgi:hypothetical protein
MRTIMLVFVLVVLSNATASSVPLFSLDLSGLAGSGVHVTSSTLASDLISLTEWRLGERFAALCAERSYHVQRHRGRTFYRVALGSPEAGRWIVWNAPTGGRQLEWPGPTMFAPTAASRL